MAVVNEVVTRFSFEGDLKPQRDFNTGLDTSIKLLAGMAAGVTAAAGAMFAWASSVFDSIDPMLQLSRETGVAVEAIQELGFAATTNGSSLDAVSASLRKVSKRAGEYVQTGGGPAKEMVDKLGISFRDANGHIKAADTIIMELTDSMRGMSQAEKMNVLDKMGIDQSMIQMLSLTGEEIDSLRAHAQRLGIVTQEQADAVGVYNDSLSILKFGMQGIQNMVAVGFAPAMGDLVDKFVGLLEANHDLIVNGLTWLGEVITSTVGMLQRMWPVLSAIAAGFVIAKMAAIGFSGIMSIILSPVVLITAALVAAVLIVDDLIVAFQGGKSVIADFFESFFGIDIRPALQAIVGAVLEMVDAIVRLFQPAVDAVMSMFKAVVALIKGDFSGAWGHITDGISSMLEFWSGLFDAWQQGIIALVQGIANLLVTAFMAAFDTLANAFQSWVDWIRGLFGKMLDGIMGMWGRVTDYLKSKMMNILPNWAVKLIGGDDSGSAVDEEAIRREAETASRLTAGFDRNEAVDRGTTQQSWNSNIDQNVEIHIATNDPQRAGAAVQDALQQQLKDSRTMSNRGGM